MEPLTERLSLKDIFKKVAAERNTPDRKEEFRAALLAEIDPDDYGFYLDEALKRLVYVLDNEVGRDVDRQLQSAERSNADPAYSLKNSRLRDTLWPEYMRKRIPTRNGVGVFLRDATEDDLNYNAEVRLEQADELKSNAERYLALAKLAHDTKTGKLGSADPDKVMAVASDLFI